MGTDSPALDEVPSGDEEADVTDNRKDRSTQDPVAHAGELEAVREAAEAALETRAAGGDGTEAQQRLTSAAKAALDEGHALSVVAEAEAAGQAAARARLRKDVLRRVERSARKLREVTAEHELVIAQADELGLAAREIAERASIAHGTVAAIVRRHRLRSDASSDDDGASSDEDLSSSEAVGDDASRGEEASPVATGATVSAVSS